MIARSASPSSRAAAATRARVDDTPARPGVSTEAALAWGRAANRPPPRARGARAPGRGMLALVRPRDGEPGRERLPVPIGAERDPGSAAPHGPLRAPPARLRGVRRAPRSAPGDAGGGERVGLVVRSLPGGGAPPRGRRPHVRGPRAVPGRRHPGPADAREAVHPGLRMALPERVRSHERDPARPGLLRPAG